MGDGFEQHQHSHCTLMLHRVFVLYYIASHVRIKDIKSQVDNERSTGWWWYNIYHRLESRKNCLSQRGLTCVTLYYFLPCWGATLFLGFLARYCKFCTINCPVH